LSSEQATGSGKIRGGILPSPAKPSGAADSRN
jgi:hypothetical protein